MKAITVEPKKLGTARLEDVAEPDAREGSVLVEAIAVGVCGTDAEIVEGKYGWAPLGKTRLVLGHESLGRVVDPGSTGGLKEGDLVVGIVRRPDPVPCSSCVVGEWDMCRNGQYTERGIKQIDREPCIGSFSIVACSVPARRVVYRQLNALGIDLPALGEALKSLNFASVDAKQLALKNGETEFLARLTTEETREDHPDALIFVGPKYPLVANVSQEIIQRLRNLDYPVFYLNYSLDPSSHPWPDAMGHIVKELNGHEYTITRPRDLFTAWSDVLSRILVTKQPTGTRPLTSTR